MKTKLKEYFKNMSNTKKIAISVLAMVFVCLVFTGSYALFNIKIANRTYVVKVGTLDIDFEDANSNLIVLNNTYPMTNNEGLATTGYTFNVSNNGTVPGKYLVRLEIADDNEIPIEYIKVAYQKTKDESISIASPSLSTPKLLSNLNDSLVILKDESIGVGKKDTINLKLWLDINAPNDVQNKQFKARIIIDSTQDYEDAKYAINTKPIIELNKDENGNIDYIIPVNGTYTELGVASVKDDKDKLTPSDVTITGTVDTTTAGTYTRTYSVTDSDNNTSTVTRTIYVGDPESLTIYHSIDEVINSFSAEERQGKEVILCGHIYGNGDMYLDCEISDDITKIIYHNIGYDEYVGRMSGALILIDDITLPDRLDFRSHTNYIIELNGHTITGSSYFSSDEGSDLVINNGNIIGTTNGIMPDGNLTLNNVNITSDGGVMIYNNSNTTTVINNSTIHDNGYSTSAITLGGTGVNNKIIINNSTLISDETIAVDISNPGCYAEFNNITATSDDNAIYLMDGVTVTINGGNYTSINNTTIQIGSDSTMNIIDGVFTAAGQEYTIENDGILNISGGRLISDYEGIYNNGTVNINQSNKPIYIGITDVEQHGNGIYNYANSILNIHANKANACTSNPNDTTSGLCFYIASAPGESYKNVINTFGNCTMNIDGGTYISGDDGINNEGILNIKNVELNVGEVPFKNYHNDSVLSICSSNVSSGINEDIYIDDGIVNYTSDNTWTNGTNTPTLQSYSNSPTLINACPF